MHHPNAKFMGEIDNLREAPGNSRVHDHVNFNFRPFFPHLPFNFDETPSIGDHFIEIGADTNLVRRSVSWHRRAKEKYDRLPSSRMRRAASSVIIVKLSFSVTYNPRALRSLSALKKPRFIKASPIPVRSTRLSLGRWSSMMLEFFDF